MRKNKKSVAILLVLCAVVTALAAGGCRKIEKPNEPSKDTQMGSVGAPEETGAPELRIETTNENDKWVVVGTTYGTFRYSSAFSDIISVKAVQHDAASNLVFTAAIDEKEIPLYTVHYNDDGEGIPLGTLQFTDASVVMQISISIADAPKDLTDNAMRTFNAAQETVNDVIVSLCEDSRFTLAE